jgi:hypothetical protein
MYRGERIRAISLREEFSGKLVGVSQKQLHWTFEISGKSRTFSLIYSVFSSKFQVLLDQKLLAEAKRALLSQFQFEIQAEGLHFRIIESLFTFDFYINEVLFQAGNSGALAEASRPSVGSVRSVAANHRLSFREIPAFFGNASQSLRDMDSKRVVADGENCNLQNLPQPQLMKRKTEPFVDTERHHTIFDQPALPLNRALQFDENPQTHRGLRLQRAQTETWSKRPEKTAPSVRNVAVRDKLQMPAIFTETAIRRTFKVPRGPPLTFDRFDPFESEGERFLETDFDFRTTFERSVVNSLFGGSGKEI